jgi:DnaK suppressor protein
VVRRVPPGAALEDVEQARKLLAAERRELERALDHRGREDDGENAGFQEPAHLATELYLDELDESVADDLRDRLAALKRAEQRLAGGTYGLTVESGRPIPDERLEVFPAAERTVEEERALDERGAS